ncbi:hypothetical protein ES332_A04G185300v1 [Gossypium tomentosum]|uniref:DUF7733 domain-containing protein n=1 Tax=Gossypium tomentosum TaxID=34277 RepID=A0A5D2QZX8_GOSTO|nr:hypothetical protein ES332_A04G185300v1 [Gossypium tomentosum]
MSGVSLAVAPRSEPDHTIAPGEKPEHKPPRQQQQQQQQQSGVGSIMGSLRVIELQLVVFVMVFSISGLVPLLDLVFPAIASAYIIALSRFAFPSNGHVSTASQEIFQGSKLFRLYVILGTAVGLFLPLAYVLGGFARGDNHDVRSATPHLFLLSFQILTENVIGGLSLFSPPVRALVPLLYTVRRIFVLVDWIHDVWLNKTLPVNAQLKDIVWHWLGKGLAAANLLYFSINLFFFLIPRFLPRAFERYFKERGEIHCKMSEDKRPIMANKSLATNKKDD